MLVLAGVTYWVPKAAQWAVVVAASVAAVVALWKVAVWFGVFTERAATLDKIAAEFRPNGGNSLRDVVDLLKKSAETAVTVAATAAEVAGRAETHAIAATEAASKAASASEANTEALKDLTTYMHDFVHANQNSTAVMVGTASLVARQVDKLDNTITNREARMRATDPKE